MSNVINNDAKEFGLHVKQGGWRLGLLVARSVEKGSAGRPGNHRTHDDSSKASAQEFARQSGTSADRVLAYLRAWNKASEEGIVPSADSLSPGQELDIDVDSLPNWTNFYTNNKGSRVSQEKIEAEKEAAAEAARQEEAAKGQKALAAALAQQKKESDAKEAAARKEEQAKAAAERKAAADRHAAEMKAQREKDKQEKLEALARLEKQLKETAKKAEFDLDSLSDTDKAKIMTVLANDPEKAAEWFKAQTAERTRKLAEAESKAKADAEKKKQQASEREARQAADRARQDYEGSALKLFVKVANEAKTVKEWLGNKPVTFDHILTSGMSAHEWVAMTEFVEDLAVEIREAIFAVNAESQLQDISE